MTDHPNATISQIHRHRSIRQFTAKPVSDDHIRTAVGAGQAASTSSAVQSYCLIRVTDLDHRAALVELTGGQPSVAACGAFFVVAGDTRRHRLLVDRAGVPYDARLEAFLLAVIDGTLFAQNVVLAFESLGYGVCYIGGLRNQIAEVDRLLALPEGVYPLYGMCVGVPDEQPVARPRLPVEAVLFEGAYPDDAAMLELIDQYDATYAEYLKQRGADPTRIWSSAMAQKFAEPRRAHLASFYTGKGANLA